MVAELTSKSFTVNPCDIHIVYDILSSTAIFVIFNSFSWYRYLAHRSATDIHYVCGRQLRKIVHPTGRTIRADCLHDENVTTPSFAALELNNLSKWWVIGSMILLMNQPKDCWGIYVSRRTHKHALTKRLIKCSWSTIVLMSEKIRNWSALRCNYGAKIMTLAKSFPTQWKIWFNLSIALYFWRSWKAKAENIQFVQVHSLTSKLLWPIALPLRERTAMLSAATQIHLPDGQITNRYSRHYLLNHSPFRAVVLFVALTLVKNRQRIPEA